MDHAAHAPAQVDTHIPAANDNAPPPVIPDSETASHVPPNAVPLTPDQAMQYAQMHGVPLGHEVEGVPANAVARPGDNEGIVSTEVTDKHWTAGKDGVGHQSTTTTTEDGKTTVDDKKTTANFDKANQGVAVTHTDSHTNKYSENVESTQSTSSGVGAGAGGVKITAGQKDEKKVGESKHESGTTANASVGWDGKVSVGTGKTDKREDEHGAVENGRNVSVGSDGLKIDRDRTTEKKVKVGDEEKVSSNKVSGGVTVGANKVGVEGSATHTTAGGSSYGVKGGVEYEDGNIKANVGGTFKDARGNSASLSLSGGVSVVCSDPVQVGNQWVVSYKKSTTLGGGGGGGSHGVGVSLGVQKDSFVEGSRKFDNKEAADKFKEHAAEELEKSGEADFSTSAGVKDIPIGESRGEGGTKTGSVGGSASVEGASLGANHTKQKTSQIDVKRVSENVVVVTYYEQDLSATDYNVGGMGVTTGRGSGSAEHSGVTYQFDISTPEGAAAYEKFCRDHEPPTSGGKLVNTDHGVDSDTHDGTKIAVLGSAEWTYATKQDTVTDAAGHKHETHTGQMRHDLDPSWIDRKLSSDKELHEEVDLTTNVDDGKLAGGSISAHISGKDGAKTREELDKLAGVHEKDVGDVKASGEWTVSADIPPEMMKDHELGMKGNASTKAQQVADDFAGSKDNWSKKVQEVASYGENDPKLKHMKLDWNVELKGDPNFPGAAGRAHNKELIEKLKADLECSNGDPKVVDEIEKEVERLRAQRLAVDPVSNPEHYTDLPLVLRQNEVAHIDADLAQLEDLRHNALVAANKTKPNESTEELKARLEKEKGKDDSKSPVQKQLDDVRDQIALADAEIAADDKVSEDKLYALDINEHDLAQGKSVNLRHAGGGAVNEYQKERSEAEAKYKQHRQAMKAIDDQRVTLMKMMTVDPALALTFALAIGAQLKLESGVAAVARMQLEQADEDINKIMGNDDEQEAEDKADEAMRERLSQPTEMAH